MNFIPSDVYPPALSSLSLLPYRAVTRLRRILLSLRTKVLPENIHLNLNGRCETALMGPSHYAEILKFTPGKSLNPFKASPLQLSLFYLQYCNIWILIFVTIRFPLAEQNAARYTGILTKISTKYQ